MAKRLFKAADIVTVDSIAMRDGVERLAGVTPIVIQNGVNVAAATPNGSRPRTRVVSIRGMAELYRILEIAVSRNASSSATPLDFIYPLWDAEYRAAVENVLKKGDIDHGRMERAEMYQLLHSALMAVSIPRSDSSPRSVYEAIFAGAAVATVDAPWIETLPDCMKARLVTVDLEDPAWFARALDSAASIVGTPYVPSTAAIETFSLEHSMRNAVSLLYGQPRRGKALNPDTLPFPSAA